MSLSTGQPDRLQHKRQRTTSIDSSQGSLRPVFKKHSEIWYDDGNVIILSQGVGFRVYKGLLAAQSEVFRDMFLLPQPPPHDSTGLPSSDDSITCPIVEVTDALEEIEALFSVLFIGRQRAISDIDTAIFCIRPAHKYGFQGILEDSLKELQRYFPADYEAYQSRMKDAESIAIAAVVLARLTDTPSLLPAALYRCCQQPADELFSGCDMGQNVFFTLETADLNRIIDRKSKVYARCTRAWYDIFKPVKTSLCNAPTTCGYTIRTIREDWTHLEYYDEDYADLLDSWEQILVEQCGDNSSNPLDSICSSCRAILSERETKAYGKVWRDIPQLLGLS